MNSSTTHHSKHVKIRRDKSTFTVSITLATDALEAIRLAQVKVKSPTKRQRNASTRSSQIEQYNQLVMTEQRRLRYTKRIQGIDLSPTKPSKHVRFTI
ncbi:uncharacterized protein SPAPADRAFT_143614 [Spathaspora passalidarum NRRL Y-27907]|uniref:Uncharacterized protein n=1 Tax=Spathaspora passalidarum (strain NRRL Y-27907 / 11-Y1) TaxID=619300 RepID=G3ATR6_SPAPN|nr:uncharacterized protein SPAPADRAFT_143614 [Spathaspora passalidarum NRRL Y-27907]EGW30293.1 hypothetical protein SPAPADRAFT_143614 [Spathaspora passalidarum NRRL Y-27907]